MPLIWTFKDCWCKWDGRVVENVWSSGLLGWLPSVHAFVWTCGLISTTNHCKVYDIKVVWHQCSSVQAWLRWCSGGDDNTQIINFSLKGQVMIWFKHGDSSFWRGMCEEGDVWRCNRKDERGQGWYVLWSNNWLTSCQLKRPVLLWQARHFNSFHGHGLKPSIGCLKASLFYKHDWFISYKDMVDLIKYNTVV